MDSFTSSPPPLIEPSSGKKASRSLILLPGFSSYRQIQCSWSPAVAVLTLSSSLLWNKVKGKKREGLSWALSLSFPWGEEEVRGEEVMEDGSYPATSPPLERSCDPSRPCLLPNLPNHCETWQMKQSFLNERKWAEYETEALTRRTCLDCQQRYLIRY